MIRAFIGLQFPEPAVRLLTAAQAGLPAGRAVPPENLHLTLAFLGNQREPVLEDLHASLSRIDAPALSLSVAGAGLIGKPRPRAVYAGVAADDGLAHLRRKVLRAAEETGIELARERFLPHVTLARLPKDLPAEDMARVEAFTARRMSLAGGPFEVGAFALFESHLKGDGALYEVLADYPLA